MIYYYRDASRGAKTFWRALRISRSGPASAAMAAMLWAAAASAQTEVQRLGTDPERKSTATRIGGREPPPPIAGMEGAEGSEGPALFGADRPAAKEGEEAQQPDETTAGKVPEMHVVEKGDTMWDICQKYFQNPWRWPQLWSENPLITNPHWIFPGDVLRLAAPSEEPIGEVGLPGTPGGTGGPGIGGGKAFSGNGIPLREFGFVDPRELAAGGEINGSREEKIMLSTGDSAYVSFSASQPLHAGDRYTIYRPVGDACSAGARARECGPVVDPGTGQVLGYLVFIIGDVQIDQVTEGQMARGTLLDLYEPAERGYKVGPVFRQFRNVEPKASAVSLESTIVSTIHPNQLIGHHMLVVMNRGRAAGVEVGNKFYIVRRGDGYRGVLQSWEAHDARFPKEVVGELMAVDVRDNLTIAYVVRGSKELRVGDVGEMRRGY